MLAEPVGTLPDGRKVHRHVLGGDGCLRLAVLDLGATVQSLRVALSGCSPTEVALGFDTAAAYLLRPEDFHGAVVGRYANRIADGDLPTPVGRHQLSRNNGRNTLHGGPDGFHRRLWTVEETDETRIRLSLTSPHGDQGFPGTLRATVTYTVAADEVRLDYSAVCDAPTAVNLTNHTYFNLAGEGSGSVLDHELQVEGDAYVPTAADGIPTGELRAVAGTPVDFRTLRPIVDPAERGGPGPATALSYDHCIVLRGEGLRPAAVLRHPGTGLTLEVLTDQPGLQVYTGGFFTGRRVGSSGVAYRPGAGVALETQHFPDSPHHSRFPPTLLLPGEELASSTIWRFATT